MVPESCKLLLFAYWNFRCYIPALDGRDIPEAMIKNLSIDLSDSKCKMYVRNFTGWTMEDIVREAAAGAPEGKSVECQHGWMYDQSAYISTAATQVCLPVLLASENTK